MKKRILSGMRPSGKLHLGHCEGVLKYWAKLQDEYECYYEIADLHALTTDYQDTSKIKENIKEMLVDWLCFGLDPEKSALFVQSEVPEHSQLHLLLSMIVPLSWLERCPTYKEQLTQLKDKDISTYGFLGYPVLQAADILLYKATAVPVGEDQLPHLELTREIARRFNYFYKEIFPEPKALLTKTPKLPGIDGRKMSKSYHNCIYLSDSGKIIEKKVMEMFTDPARVYKKDKGHPAGCVVFAFHQIYNKEEKSQIEKDCLSAKIGCTDCKKILSERLVKSLQPLSEKRKEFVARPKLIDDILKQGKENAGKIAKTTLREAREALKI
ncbi:MAG: tryptophan--tRNA ligase [bacterium (Candidatus Ratteibacteria) CG_4_10_14_3_um_filter_41_18]|uniref:Tryptophan--tRNA ligase n=4 Tax=Candidatus Ratteibacteria TaxID=2979319 RepID=A0A2M7YHQ2_9BACT|nr:MAG: tryptophan--tRNA ligase [Candidatus Omnitrophica bacterium CG1_02_41_171]PIV64325.1 MAG: tryptophan--tRNA ligase [bacterium (Candidatus Ratteibacteria) CG01_land_8_20_14_3_00_40_19]PIW30545.1 MAG: tryptophan--tRNA ligase [bacterium (Candidatus Ratteibacteria) CG15_BIG_FIL_POST_REV_8_21_14_020_41_12]PIW74000.1 MAG: tryptophan--tRNA ligase [bacterium (Candidatus Ratteibacteria) CG_4_8_14_3_um_filter_41_36]PIX77750.1 MAG: tryptophan--tRNA ligase [bacterium (Candidatus Ratteibacteria) CG_4_